MNKYVGVVVTWKVLRPLVKISMVFQYSAALTGFGGTLLVGLFNTQSGCVLFFFFNHVSLWELKRIK